MTRKDYIKLAAALRSELGRNDLYTNVLIADTIVMNVAATVARVLELDNPRFDCNRFMDAVRGGK